MRCEVELLPKRTILWMLRKGGEVGMTDRETVIKGLECCYADGMVQNCEECPYAEQDGTCYRIDPLLRDALDLLKRSFTPQEVYDTVIEHAQHDKRFKLGDKIDYSFTDVVDILNIELMCKAGDM